VAQFFFKDKYWKR